MKASGKTTGSTAKGLFGMLEVTSTSASLKQIRRKDMESTSMKMDVDTKGTGKLMLKKDRVRNSSSTETSTLATTQVG